MKKNKASGYFIFIAVFTFLTIFTLVVQNSYHNLVASQNNTKDKANITPFDPKLDLSIVSEIEKREDYSDTEISIINDNDSKSTPVVTVTPVKQATESAVKAQISTITGQMVPNE